MKDYLFLNNIFIIIYYIFPLQSPEVCLHGRRPPPAGHGAQVHQTGFSAVKHNKQPPVYLKKVLLESKQTFDFLLKKKQFIQQEPTIWQHHLLYPELESDSVTLPLF